MTVRDNALLHMAGLSFAVTANELAVEVMKLEGVKISSVPKRIPELKKYGHIQPVERRKCRVTGENAWAFRVTASGLEHLRRKGLYLGGAVAVVGRDPVATKPVVNQSSPPKAEPVVAVVNKKAGRSALGDLKSFLS